MGNRRRQPLGFTLLELLVATAMTAVLAGSLYATLHVAFGARRSALATVEQVRRAELAVELVRADLESAVVPNGILAGPFLGEDATGASGRPSDGLVFYCTADGATQTEGTGDIRMVEFSCQPAEDGTGMVLCRRLTTNLLATKVQEPVEEVLCRGVRAFDLKYFDGMDWQDAWDSTSRDSTLPLAVEVTLELSGQEEASTEGTAAEEVGGEEAVYKVVRVFQLACGSTPEASQPETAQR